jgi:peptide/histidine transporter 3/4
MFTLVGLLEFFYREAPSTMKSLSTSFTFLSMSLGYFLSTVFVNVINAVTKRITPSKQGWLHGFDLNQNNLNLFYWFLAILSCLNFFNFLYWASWYKYKSEEDSNSTSLIITTKELGETPLLIVGERKHDDEEDEDKKYHNKAKAKESSQTSEANTEGPSSSDETDDGQKKEREWKHR